MILIVLFVYLQLMAVSVCGLLGQNAVRRVGLVLSLEAEPVITRHLLTEDRTALGTPLRRRVVNSRRALVRNIEVAIGYLSLLFKFLIVKVREFHRKDVRNLRSWRYCRRTE